MSRRHGTAVESWSKEVERLKKRGVLTSGSGFPGRTQEAYCSFGARETIYQL